MNLKELLHFKEAVIQCHDGPDPDAIASAFALWCYLEDNGVKAKIIYGGAKQIAKPNVLLMLKVFNIPLEHVSRLAPPKLLITVDCQYGAGNVTRFECEKFAVFDHHRQEIPDSENLTILPQLGSCATLIWHLLQKESYDFSSRNNIITSLVYGMLTDTLEGAESRHPLDRDLADTKGVDRHIIKFLMNSAITMDDLQIVADALSSSQLVGSIGLLKAGPCDPNLLGFACDVAKQVDRFDSCVIYAPHNAGIKFSVRSCVREIMADELAAFITENVGSGGGNLEKAGGYIALQFLKGVTPTNFMMAKLNDYQTNYTFIYPDKNSLDFSNLQRYRKLPIPVGYAPTTSVFPVGTKIRVRTLEGDLDVQVSEDIFLMIGVEGEIYPIRRSRFNETYETEGSAYTLNKEYSPMVINLFTGEKSEVLPHAKICVSQKEKIIHAAVLDKFVKVFTEWDREKYFLGKPGDYIAASKDDFSDIYVIKGNIMAKTYERI